MHRQYFEKVLPNPGGITQTAPSLGYFVHVVFIEIVDVDGNFSIITPVFSPTSFVCFRGAELNYGFCLCQSERRSVLIVIKAMFRSTLSFNSFIFTSLVWRLSSSHIMHHIRWIQYSVVKIEGSSSRHVWMRCRCTSNMWMRSVLEMTFVCCLRDISKIGTGWKVSFGTTFCWHRHRIVLTVLMRKNFQLWIGAIVNCFIASCHFLNPPAFWPRTTLKLKC